MLASAKAGGIAATVRKLAEPIAAEMGYRIWDVEFLKEGAGKYLRITLDNDEGINIEDCEKFHRAIDPVLDEADPIDEAYCLEVSSPGIERELRTEEHLRACIGETVEAKLFAAVEGTKNLRGVLSAVAESAVTLSLPSGKDVAIEKKNVSRMTTVYDFD